MNNTNASAVLADLDAILAGKLGEVQAESTATREEWENIKELRVSVQRKVEDIERAYNLARQNVARISDEYERLAALRERAANAMALKPPELPKAPRRAIRAIRDVPRLKQELLAKSTEIRTEAAICGVYFLLQAAEVVYVGQSVNILSRVATHATEGQKQFDRWCFVEVERRELDQIEGFYITLLRPQFNKVGKPVLLAENDPKLSAEAA